MSPQNILSGQILVVFTTIILTTWYATQWVAQQFDYDAYLGTGFAELGNHKIYAPWSLFKWWYQFDAYAPRIFSRGGQIAAGGGLLGIVFAVKATQTSRYQANQAHNNCDAGLGS